MKKLLFATLAILAIACSSDDAVPTTPEENNPENPTPVVVCDNMFEGDITLSTQEEVNAFAANGYCGVKGRLFIGSRMDMVEGTPVFINSDITNLQGLEGLKIIDKELAIGINPLLTSLNGLNNLEQVSDLIIQYANALVNLQGLNSLAIFTGTHGNGKGSIDINSNTSLVNLEGLDSVTLIGNLSIKNNPVLTNLHGLENLEKVVEQATISGDENLQSLTGLDNLKRAFIFNCTGNNSLSSLQALHNFNYANTMSLIGNKLLVNLKGLEGLKEIETFEIWANESMTSLEGLQNLKLASDISISDNNALASISHLSGLTSFTVSPYYKGNSMLINDNDALTSLDGLQNITVFTGRLIVSQNLSLNNLCALQSIVSIGNFGTPVNITQNLYNPSVDAIAAGNCSQ